MTGTSPDDRQRIQAPSMSSVPSTAVQPRRRAPKPFLGARLRVDGLGEQTEHTDGGRPAPDGIDRLLSSPAGSPERLVGIDDLLARLAENHELPLYKAVALLPSSAKSVTPLVRPL